jgi:hypothetical protein
MVPHGTDCCFELFQAGLLGEASMENTSLDWRYRDKDGQIAAQHGETLISSLRRTYGQEFACNVPGHFKLSEVLHALDDQSLNCLISEHHRLTC